MMHRESCALFGIKEEDLVIVNQICKEEDPTIISTHDAIQFQLTFPATPLSVPEAPAMRSAPVENKRLIWESADIELYQNCLETILEQNFQFWNTPECISTLALLIPRAFIEAADFAVPSKQRRETNFTVKKSEDWLKAETAAKKATKKWKSMGKPRNEDNQLFIAKKETRLNLRKSISKCNNSERIRDNNAMMEANFRDPKLFSKLVNQKRNKNQGYTAMIKVNDTEYRGDAQVLAGFFTYHDGNSSPPPLSKSDVNTTYYYSTINVEAISYLIKQRNWKLPQLNFNQMQNIIERLKSNKYPDYFGFSAKHVKNGGFVSTHFLLKYMNTSFQFIEYGVPEGELVGCASLVHKSGKKSLSEPKHFRKITVCALLGQMN